MSSCKVNAMGSLLPKRRPSLTPQVSQEGNSLGFPTETQASLEPLLNFLRGLFNPLTLTLFLRLLSPGNRTSAGGLAIVSNPPTGISDLSSSGVYVLLLLKASLSLSLISDGIIRVCTRPLSILEISSRFPENTLWSLVPTSLRSIPLHSLTTTLEESRPSPSSNHFKTSFRGWKWPVKDSSE